MLHAVGGSLTSVTNTVYGRWIDSFFIDLHLKEFMFCVIQQRHRTGWGMEWVVWRGFSLAGCADVSQEVMPPRCSHTVCVAVGLSFHFDTAQPYHCETTSLLHTQLSFHFPSSHLPDLPSLPLRRQTAAIRALAWHHSCSKT